jgi:hypothetical protein
MSWRRHVRRDKPMTDTQMFNGLKVFALILGMVSTMLTFAATSPDLGWTKAQTAYAMMFNQGIAYVLLFLPQLQKAAGNIRGDSRDD